MSIQSLIASVRLELKALGLIYVVPFIAGFFTLLFSLFFHINGLRDTMHVIPPIEMILPVFAAWNTVFYMSLVFDDVLCEVIFSFPNPIWKLVFSRLLIIFISYSLFIAGVVLIAQFISGTTLFPSLFFQISGQSLFYIGLATLSMCFFSNVNYSLSVVAIYLCVQVLTQGSVMPLINVYLFNNRVQETSFILIWSIKQIFLSLALFILSYTIAKNKFSRTNIGAYFRKKNY
ncbi:MAG: hypothetical protein SCM11_08290 [Bacillota bacterium]|nr:hypothetical protein [Bacillota bacterium]